MTVPELRSGPITAFLFLAFVLAGGGSPAPGQTYHMGGDPHARRPGGIDSTVTITVESLAPGVYAAKVSYVWTGWVELKDGILVIDTGFNEESARALADTIRARSGALPIRYVVNTHRHKDHTGGDRYFAALGATFVAHAEAADEIQQMLNWPAGETGDTLSRLGITPKLTKISRRNSYGGPKQPVQVISLGRPAHTGGDLVVYLPKQKILFAGDLVSNRSVPWLLDPDMSVDGWLKSLDSLLTPAFQIATLVPGHGVMPKTPLEAIQFTNHYLVDLREQAAKAAAMKISLLEVKEWGDLGAYQGLEFYDDVHFMNLRRLYNEAKGIKTPGRKNTHAFKRT